MDADIRKLVSQDVIVSKDLSDIASCILDELDAPVVEMADTTTTTPGSVRRRERKSTSAPRTKSKGGKKQPVQPVLSPVPDPSDEDDDSHSAFLDDDDQADDDAALDQVKATIRQLCSDISDATYRTFDVDACAKLSSVLGSALAEFQASTQVQPMHEEIVYANFY